ncbi:MAG: TAXI family TRAP transporter solute-binding subunit [Candidatus Riflebacteria bacterium]|nr:TAXI family TRAP transporter solute-binding subunit [Candidatus Riflebacteria bacterium]
MVRSRTVLFITLLFCLALPLSFFWGCGKSAHLSRKQLTIATGSRSGLYFPVGEAIARILTETFKDVQIQVLETDGSRQNISLMKEGKANLAIIQNDIAYYAVSGENMFNHQKVDGITGIATLFPEIVQIIVRHADGVTSLDALKGKKVAVDLENSGTFYNAQQLLTHAKLWDGIHPMNMAPSQAMAALEDKTIDAFFFTSGLPNPNLAELASRLPVDVVSITPELVQEMVNAYPFYFPTQIPKGTYVGMASDSDGLEINAILAADGNFTDDDIYLVTHAIFGSLDTIKKAHKTLSQITKASLRRQLSIPLSEGARRALAE